MIWHEIIFFTSTLQCLQVYYSFFHFKLFLDLETTPNTGASNTGVSQGAGLKYKYPAVKSFPKPRFTWRKGSITMSETQRISFSAAGNLYIGNVDINDAAHYTSAVENTVTAGSFNRGPLTVSLTGEFFLNLYNIHVSCSCTQDVPQEGIYRSGRVVSLD